MPRRQTGCFCDIMQPPRACLSHTCPDCGAVGRHGAAIAHAEGCAP